MNKFFGKASVRYSNKDSISVGRPKRLDEFEDEDVVVGRSGIYARTLRCMDFDYYLDSNIREPNCYRDILYCIHHMDKNDEMRFIIDSSGGRLDSCMRLISAINETEGTVIVIGAGLAASAAAILFLQSPNIVVTPNMSMMLHAASYGAVGKEAEVSSMVHYSEKMLDKLTSESYQGFLTPLEIEHLKIGKDYFFDADEIIQRLEMREKFREEQLKEKTTPTKKKKKSLK